MIKNLSNTESLIKAPKSTRHAELSRSESEASKNTKSSTQNLDSKKLRRHTKRCEASKNFKNLNREFYKQGSIA